MQDHATSHVLTLREVASWQFPVLVHGMENDRPTIVAAIPSLQRGAVWKPQQVELLWDSVLRGFPIGSLVVSSLLETQQSRSGQHGAGWATEQLTHHLLDGQQRCNAIALGFFDPFADTDSDPDSTLWLDLAPEPHFSLNSSRAFLLRLCTRAHPWGYGTQDELEKLSAHQVREALRDDYQWPLQPHEDAYQRPRPKDTWPHKAGVPVPLAWLLQCAALPKDGSLWVALRARLEQVFSVDALHARHWARKAYDLLQQPESETLHDLAQA